MDYECNQTNEPSNPPTKHCQTMINVPARPWRWECQEPPRPEPLLQVQGAVSAAVSKLIKYLHDSAFFSQFHGCIAVQWRSKVQNGIKLGHTLFSMSHPKPARLLSSISTPASLILLRFISSYPPRTQKKKNRSLYITNPKRLTPLAPSRRHPACRYLCRQ